MNRKQIVTRNTDEVVTEEEIDELLEQDSPVAYLGFEPSGMVHPGHWRGISKLEDLSDAGFDTKVLLADIHAEKNEKGTREQIETVADYMEDVFREMGVGAEVVRGSDFQYNQNYREDLDALETEVPLKRAIKSSPIDADNLEHLSGVQTSTVVYPLMQALDIPHLDADMAIGGMDQRKIHMLARDHLPDIGYEAPTSMHYGLIPSLKDPEEKMSSSVANSGFGLHENEQNIINKIEGGYMNPDEGIERNPVMQLADLFTFQQGEGIFVERPEEYGGNVEYGSFEELNEDLESGEMHPADLKPAIGQAIADQLAPAREAYLSDDAYAETLAEMGYEDFT